MSKITFVPKPGTRYESGWPDKVIGDGFIDLELKYSYADNSAIYRDNFGDEYEFFEKATGEWTVEVREDG